NHSRVPSVEPASSTTSCQLEWSCRRMPPTSFSTHCKRFLPNQTMETRGLAAELIAPTGCNVMRSWVTGRTEDMLQHRFVRFAADFFAPEHVKTCSPRRLDAGQHNRQVSPPLKWANLLDFETVVAPGPFNIAAKRIWVAGHRGMVGA